MISFRLMLVKTYSWVYTSDCLKILIILIVKILSQHSKVCIKHSSDNTDT